MRTKIDYGIDLGTTNSAIAKIVKGKPVIIKSDTQKDTVPSCVHFNRRQEVAVGEPAMNVMKADNGRAMKNFTPGETNTYIEFKRTMGTAATYPSKNMSKELTSEDLSAEVLRKLKTLELNENISAVVITVPAKFTMPQNEATIKAAGLAGFQRAMLLQEPIAAATAYGLDAEKTDGYWLVFDFGGGTFDAALIKAEEGVMTVCDTAGDNWLGGKNLDEAIVDQIIIPYLQQKYAIDSILDHPQKRNILRNGLKRFAEETKIQMSFKDAYNILSDLGDLPFEDEYGEEPEVDIAVTQKDMERVLAPIFQKAIDITKELLKRNNLKGSDVDSLILVGGPTHSPILRRMLKEQITEKVNVSVDPMTVVAQGAALYASGVDIESVPPIVGGCEEPKKKIIGDSDRDEIYLDLKYVSATTEMSELVSIQVSREKSKGKLPNKIFAEIKRSDGGSSSGLKEINDRRTILFEVDLLEKKANSFEIVLMDGDSNRIPCSPQEITILQGIGNPEPVLAYNIGIAKYFDEYEEDLFFPVKGLEKNKTIPESKLVGAVNGLRTRSEIRRGNPDDRIRIPIYQGDHDAKGSQLELNHLICEVIITGKTIPGNLPEGSAVDITIKIDQSLKMYFSAYFPALDYSEEMEIEIQQIQIPSVESLRRDIGKAKREAEKLNEDEVAQGLSELEDQLEYEEGSPDGRMNIQDKLRNQLLKLPKTKANWEDVAAEMNEAYSELKGHLVTMGDSRLDDEADDIARKIRQITAEKNINEAKKVIQEIRMLIMANDPQERKKALVGFLLYCNQNFDTIRWKNPGLAQQLVNEGMKEFALARFDDSRIDTICAIAIELIGLRDPIPGGGEGTLK